MDNIWDNILRLISQKLNKQSFDTWFSETSLYECEQGTLKVLLPTVFVAEWINENYLELIKSCLAEVNPKISRIEFVISELTAPETRPPAGTPAEVSVKPAPEGDPVAYESSNLNPRYTFDRFVVGSCNSFAHAASLAVAERPAKAYNPLYIYGGVGLGKTHLLHAIGHSIQRNAPQARICYKTSEEFMNELINAIRFDRTIAFRNKYRKVDALLIDDIQFITGKERTQEEFFHTFNTLHEAHKQIVITSDCPPKDISTIEERLRSRFGWGLIADIQPPDLETKVAILKKKADTDHFNVPEDVYLLIASNIVSNIRELEGALNRIAAYSALNGTPITVDVAKGVLKDVLIEREKAVTIDKIQKIVAEQYNLKVSDLKSKVRTASLALPRQIAMYLCRKFTNNSLPKIGESFGGKDHTTVLHACSKIEAAIDKDPAMKNRIQYLINHIYRM